MNTFNGQEQTIDVSDVSEKRKSDVSETRKDDEIETRKAPAGDATSEMSKLKEIDFDALTENFQNYIESANKTMEQYQKQLSDVPKMIEKGLSEMRSSSCSGQKVIHQPMGSRTAAPEVKKAA